MSTPEITVNFSPISTFPSVGDATHEQIETVCNEHKAELDKVNDWSSQVNALATWINSISVDVLNRAEQVDNNYLATLTIKSDVSALKTDIENIRWQNLAALPLGTINDYVIASNTVWSSYKVNQWLNDYRLEDVEIAGVIQLDEGSSILLQPEIDDEFLHVFATCDKGTITRQGDNVYYTAPSVEEDTYATITLYATKEGFLKSNDATQQILIKQLQIQVIADLVINDLAGITDNVNFLVTGTDIKALADNATAKTPIETYANGLKKYKLSFVSTPQRINVLDDSTNTILKTDASLQTGDKIIVNDGSTTQNLTITDTSLSDAAISTNHDPFGDGSGIALYRFEDNLDDESGNFNGSWSSNSDGYSFIDGGKFDKCLNCSNNWGSFVNMGELNNRNTDKTITLWLKDCTTGDPFTQKEKEIYLRVDSGGLRVTAVSVNDGWRGIYTNVNVNDGGWHFVVLHINADGTSADITVDNVDFRSVEISGGAISSSTSYTGVGKGVTGKIDQVRYFDRELTAAEKEALFLEESKMLSIDISAASLTNTVEKAFKEQPEITTTCGGTTYQNTVESFSLSGDDLTTTHAEQSVNGDTIVFNIKAKNKDDVIKSITSNLWE